jgi:hypothetical protein
MPAEQACTFAGGAARCPSNLHLSGGNDSFFVTVPNSPPRLMNCGNFLSMACDLLRLHDGRVGPLNEIISDRTHGGVCVAASNLRRKRRIDIREIGRIGLPNRQRTWSPVKSK